MVLEGQQAPSSILVCAYVFSVNVQYFLLAVIFFSLRVSINFQNFIAKRSEQQQQK